MKVNVNTFSINNISNCYRILCIEVLASNLSLSVSTIISGFLCLFLQKTKLDGPFQPGLMGHQLDLCEITAKTEILEIF